MFFCCVPEFVIAHIAVFLARVWVWSRFHSHCLLLRGYTSPSSEGFMCFISSGKFSAMSLLIPPVLHVLSFLLLKLQNVGDSFHSLSLLGSHVSSLYLSMLYLGDFPPIHFSNPLALLINLSVEVLISTTVCFIPRRSVGPSSDLRGLLFYFIFSL